MTMKAIKIIDLSYPLRSDMMVYPGTERPVYQWLGKVNSEGYNLTRMSMVVHTGTHVDAPSHFIENGSTLDEIPLDRFLGTAKLYRYTKMPTGQEITLDDVNSSGFELEENQIFVLATGIEKYAETARYNEHFPVPADDLLNFLIDKKIKAYMTDATAVDAVNSETDAKHKQLLGAEIPIVENLRNLHQLPENSPFLISALPLYLSGREGSPCRAVAIPQIEALQQE